MLFENLKKKYLINLYLFDKEFLNPKPVAFQSQKQRTRLQEYLNINIKMLQSEN